MKWLRYTGWFLSTFFILGSGLAQTDYNKAMGLRSWLELEEKSRETYAIRAICINRGVDPRFLEYQLKLTKEDNRGNKSANSQGSAFSIEPGEEKTLSEQQFNISAGSILRVELYLSEEGTVILADTLIRIFPKKVEAHEEDKTGEREGGGNNSKDQIRNQRADPDLFDIGGFVFDETRSRAGRDLYNVFFSQWLSLDVSGNYTIRFEELPPRRGINSIIRIYLNDELLHEQFIRPNYDFIEQLAGALVPYLQGQIQRLGQIQEDLDNEIIGNTIDVY